MAQAVYAASATAAAEQRLADARISQQRREIETLRTQLTTTAARDDSARRRLQSQLAEAQERFVQQLAEHDRAYAQEIAVFRSAVQDIASTPEGEAALRQYNAGDEIGALAVLDRLVEARERARQVRANIETAAERRRVATLALDAKNKGKVRSDAVIARYEEVTRLDSGVPWDWIQLSRLYVEVGRLQDARQAALKAADTAGNQRDRSVALGELGNVLVVQGDLAGAKLRYQEASDILKRLSSADPSSARLQRDVSVSLNKLGFVLVAQGDLAGAKQRYQESLEIAKRLSAADPSSASLQRDVSVNLSNLGDVLVAQGDLAGAKQRYQESSEIFKRLSAESPSSASLQRDVSLSLENKFGNVLVAQRDLAGAKQLYQESLEIDKRLSAADPSSASLQRDVSVSLTKLGDALVAQGAVLAGAKQRYQESSDALKRLSVAGPELGQPAARHELKP